MSTKAEIPPSPIWERQAGEPNKWYARFQLYLLLGPSRSLYAAYTEERQARGAKSAQKRAGLPQSWRQAAETWEWNKRAEAWDEAQRRQQLEDWARRRDELREQEWKYSQDLLDKARQMLVFPLAKTVRTTEQGGQTVVTEVYPAQWKVSDAARLLDTASKLARLALGEETERVGVNTHMLDVRADDWLAALRTVTDWERDTYGTLSTDKPTDAAKQGME